MATACWRGRKNGKPCRTWTRPSLRRLTACPSCNGATAHRPCTPPLGLDWSLEADTTRYRARTIDERQHPDNGQRSYFARRKWPAPSAPRWLCHAQAQNAGGQLSL